MTYLFKVVNRGVFCVITEMSVRGRIILREYLERYVSTVPKTVKGKLVYEKSKHFIGINRAQTEYRLQINQYLELCRYLEYRKIFQGHDFQYELDIPAKGEAVELPILDKWTPRDYQEDAKAYSLNLNPRCKLLGMDTGTGKTYTACLIANALGERTMILPPGDVSEQWSIELLKILDIEEDDVANISGRNNLLKLLAKADAGKELPKVIFVSPRTLMGLITDYEEGGLARSNGIHPEEVFTKLKIGLTVVDEVHADFFTNYKIMLYTAVRKTVYMSATLLSLSKFMADLYAGIFPKSERFNGPVVTPYIDAYACSYSAINHKRINTRARGSLFYSHIEFEKSILKSDSLRRNFGALVSSIVEEGFHNRNRGGEKVLILTSSTDMAGFLAEYLNEQYEEYIASRYAKTEGDTLEESSKADIIVATVLSAGKGLDIPKLITLILTVSIISPNSVYQIKGRLRPLKSTNESRRRFYWLYCKDIPKHVEYDKSRRTFLRPTLANIVSYDTQRRI